MKVYYVYLLSNKLHTTFYIEVTRDLVKSVFEHKQQLGDGYTRTHKVDKLLYYEQFKDKEEAILRERQLKNGPLEWKRKVISEFNPRWQDLYETLED